MADLSNIGSSQPVMIVGADSNGVETYPVNSNSDGRLLVSPNLYSPPTFTLQQSTLTIANNKSMIALYNGSSNKKILIKYIKIINNQVSAITGTTIDFRAKRITGLSGGTPISLQPYDTIDMVTSGIIAATNGAVSGESSLDLFRRVWSSDEWGVGTSDTEAYQNAFQQIFYTWSEINGAKGIVLRPGEGLTIKCVTSSTSGNFDFELTFTEE